jgi:hypothetical protein
VTNVNWDQLVQGVELPFHPDLKVPALTEVLLPVPQPEPVADVRATAHADVVSRLAGHVTPGMTVAVGGGSRGLTDRVGLMSGVISGLRVLGAEPFVVPAMGSHGGATAEGQKAMLESLGMTEEAIGAEIRATMETVEVARTASGMPIYLDRHAAGADRIFPVNRTKPHTCFKGPIESGCTKMAVVGFGKQPGAAQIHACGPEEMRNRILDGIRDGSIGTQFGDAGAVATAIAAATVDPLLDASREGRAYAQRHGGGSGPGLDDADVVTIAEGLAGSMLRTMEPRIGDALQASDPAAQVSSAFREWRGPRIDRLVTDAALRAFSASVLRVASGGKIRWIVASAEQPCADCSDNALEGAVPSGSQFPTGHQHPPDHAGCRCLILPTLS